MPRYSEYGSNKITRFLSSSPIRATKVSPSILNEHITTTHLSNSQQITMFSKLFVVSAVFFVFFTGSNVAQASSSGTSVLQGCESVEKATDPAAAAVLASMGLVAHNPNTLVGLTCAPTTGSG